MSFENHPMISAMNPWHQLQFENRYFDLPEVFYSPSSVLSLAGGHLINFNEDVARLLGLGHTEEHQHAVAESLASGQVISDTQPIAMCYSGHQFGYYVERLGDGRAVLLGQVRNPKGELWDLHLKGSGPTLYSRGGDGRAVLRSSIREYLCSEAMHGLGIPTTRALCLVGSEEGVHREQIESAAMVVRVAQSHVRFGTFEYLYHNEMYENLKVLADYVIAHHFPEIELNDQRYAALLYEVAKRTAELIAKWQGVGFCHGVMNSDNMSILGLTLDYGPFGFMDTFEAKHICNHSDHYGRYAYDQQPDIGLFNMSCLAQAMLPLLAETKEHAIEMAKASFDVYREAFSYHYGEVIRHKLGLLELQENDRGLWKELLALMEKQVDFTAFFRALSSFELNDAQTNSPLRDMFIDREAFDHWATKYSVRLQAENRAYHERKLAMNAVNPKYILRNYLAEQAIRKAEDEGDYGEIESLLRLLQAPFDEQPEWAHYADLPPDWATQLSVSCSS